MIHKIKSATILMVADFILFVSVLFPFPDLKFRIIRTEVLDFLVRWDA
jgi:hypothetical protein